MANMGSVDIATVLRREIAKGKYNPQDRLPPSRDLAEQFGVARNTLREALKQMEVEGLVATLPGSGTYVTGRPADVAADAIASASPLELIDARFALEPHICRLCVLHARREDIETLSALCDQMEASKDDRRAFSAADTAFHQQLAASTRNNLLIWMIGQITQARANDEWTRMRRITLNLSTIAQYNTQHRQILNAIRSREPERAANIMKEQLETARLSLTRAADA